MRKLWGGKFWSDRGYIGTVGDDSLKIIVVKRGLYIALKLQ